MENLKQINNKDNFSWDMIGDLSQGRTSLGDTMPVLVYRLMEYTMREVLINEFGKEKSKDLFRKAGKSAGTSFTKKFLDTSVELPEFIDNLHDTLKKLQIGILRLERIDEDGSLIITVSEDLDCSGMPVLGEAVCNYDEGFIEGILGTYTKKDFNAVEIDCWAKGDRVCRFCATQI